jgi:AcrR family transcriptional regulator
MINEEPNGALSGNDRQRHTNDQPHRPHNFTPRVVYGAIAPRNLLGSFAPNLGDVKATGSVRVPRQVDHLERRRQIAEAVWRLAGRGGLENVTLRQVAAEAGFSPRLLQYYFGTRNDLLLGALEILNSDAEQQARVRVSALGSAPGMRAIVRGVLMELLPIDSERRSRYLVHVAYFIRFLHDPSLRSAVQGTSPSVEELVADLIVEAQRLNEADRAVDAKGEADLLVAATEGLQAQVLLEQRTPDEAIAIIERQLARIFKTDNPVTADPGRSS